MSASESEPPNKFLDLTIAAPGLKGDGWRAKVRNGLEKVLGFATLRKVFIQAAKEDSMECPDRVLQMMQMTIDSRDIHETIPADGGVIVISNHPFGGADAIAMCSLCLNRRSDSKILANSVVHGAPKFRDFLLPLKILKEQNAKRHNLMTLKHASTHVANGGLLGVFPAGGVSKYRKDLGFQHTDGPWSEHIARIALKTKMPVVPIFFEGRAPAWFHLLGGLAPMLRAALIPRVFIASKGQVIKCRAGEIITHDMLKDAENPTEFLREAVYAVGSE